MAGVLVVVCVAGSLLPFIRTYLAMAKEKQIVTVRRELHDRALATYRAGDKSQAAMLFEQAANQGDVESQDIIGWTYVTGDGVSTDVVAGMRWLTRASESGSDDATTKLGVMYWEGVGVARDEKLAERWFRAAAGRGYPEAENNLGLLLEQTAQDDDQLTEAAHLYRRAADAGYMGAQLNLGNLYYDGRGVSNDFSQAFMLYSKAAQSGEPDPQYSLGMMYLQGLGTKQSIPKAVELFQKSSEQGSLPASAQLALMYMNGRGVPRDDHRAAALLLPVAKQGDGAAAYALGLLLLTGKGMDHDSAKAAHWFQVADRAGDYLAKNALGTLYERGEGVGQDFSKAVVLYQGGAAAGDSYAMDNLANLYLRGKGVERDEKIGEEWLRKAAEAGHDRARRALWVRQREREAAAKPFLTVTLTNEERMIGNLVTNSDDQILLEVGNANQTIFQTRTIPKSEIKLVEPETPEHRETRQAFDTVLTYTLTPDGIFTPDYYREGLAQFRRFLLDHGDTEYALAVRQRMAEWEAEVTKIASGLVKLDGHWMTPEQREQMVYVNGRWLTKEVADQMRRNDLAMQRDQAAAHQIMVAARQRQLRQAYAWVPHLNQPGFVGNYRQPGSYGGQPQVLSAWPRDERTLGDGTYVMSRSVAPEMYDYVSSLPVPVTYGAGEYGPMINPNGLNFR
jgi:uncharacterized protein